MLHLRFDEMYHYPTSVIGYMKNNSSRPLSYQHFNRKNSKCSPKSKIKPTFEFNKGRTILSCSWTLFDFVWFTEWNAPLKQLNGKTILTGSGNVRHCWIKLREISATTKQSFKGNFFLQHKGKDLIKNSI